jgi:alcohol dehydrogenase class IV
MRDLELYIPTQIFSSRGAVKKLGSTCLRGSTRVLLIANSSLQDSRSLKELRRSAEASGLELIVEPEVDPFAGDEVADRLLEIARISYVEAVIGFGDVTALSTARAVAVLHAQPFAARDLKGAFKPETPPLPYLEIPAVVSSPFFFNGGMVLNDRVEKTARFVNASGFAPCAFFQDPIFLLEFSRKLRIAGLLETLLLAVEGYFSKASSFFADTLLLRGIGLSLECLPGLLRSPDDLNVLTRVQQAGFFTGFGLSMSSPGWGTAAAHLLGSSRRVPSAVVATILLPYVLEYGLEVCPEKVARMGNMLGENLKGLSVVAAADRVVESIRASLGVEQLPGRLSELGVDEALLQETAARLEELPFLADLPSSLGAREFFTYLKNAL